jgi:signal peptidase
LKTLKILQRVALSLMSLLGICTVLGTVVCLVMNIRPVAVVSGSMEPAVPTGALVLHGSQPASELVVGDIVTVRRTDADGVVTHRIVHIEPRGDGKYALTLRGDNNKKDDPTPYVVDKADRLYLSIPKLGGTLMWMRANPIATAAILLGLLVFSLWPSPRFQVHTADGRVLRNLTRREANVYIEETKRAQAELAGSPAAGPISAGPVASAGSVSTGTPTSPDPRPIV